MGVRRRLIEVAMGAGEYGQRNRFEDAEEEVWPWWEDSWHLGCVLRWLSGVNAVVRLGGEMQR